MRFGLSEQVLSNIIEVISTAKSVQRAVLFGSRARGDFRTNSDIDLAIYSNDGLIAELSLDLSDIVGVYKINIIDMHSLDNDKLRLNIEQQGIEIFSRQG